jgi:alpha-tubulin suppressor-like RCC1 family protein
VPGFNAASYGDLANVFVSEYELIDRYVGDSLWVTGRGSQGGIGDNTNASKSSPVQTVAGGTNWKQCSAGGTTGGEGNCAAIKTDGTLWLWGYNDFGQLGDNTSAHKSSPVQTVAGGTNWKQLSAGGMHCGAIKTDGTLWLWGGNFNGNLGDNTVTRRSSPVQTVAGGTNWKQVSTGLGSNGFGYASTAAIKTDGTLWTWGYNASGGLGDNTITSKSSPVQTVAGGTNWKQVSSSTGNGGSMITAIKTDGTLWTWGRNSSGQLGDNTIVDKSSPVQTVAGGTNWKQVSAAGTIVAAIKTDGTLWLWGDNSNGQLGDNTTTAKSSPVQTVAGGTNWKQVSVSLLTGAIKTDGTLWLWGYNTFGGLGDNTVVPKSSPVQTVAGGTNWKQVATTSSNAVAITYTS